MDLIARISFGVYYLVLVLQAFSRRVKIWSSKLLPQGKCRIKLFIEDDKF